MDAERIAEEVAARVRELVGEAEERARAIVAEAEDEATRIRARAESDARRRLDDVKRAIEDLQGRLEVEPGPVVVPEPEPPSEPEPGPVPVPEPTPDPAPEPQPDPIPEPSPPPDEGTPPVASGPPSAANGNRSGDESAARLVAMDMALEGATREEIDARLARDFDLADRGQVVDDVLALAGA